ncbi:uncharacterized protein JCM15063_005779 [Sporobolomyces koalae]|uniref:uncharacterized protein n=1 Tax=Sporobolomyces koalae TaxID=500713 RepID=UPI00317B9000
MEEESPLEFIERWTAQLKTLDRDLDQSESNEANRVLQRLSVELTARAGELPVYELGRCERELKTMRGKVDAQTNKSIPKSKFSFKRSVPAVAATVTSTNSSTRTPNPELDRSRLVKTANQPIPPPTSRKLCQHRTSTLTYASLPHSTTNEALLLEDLDSCHVDLVRTGASTATFPALYLSRLAHCTVLLPRVKGSVMIVDCRDCTIALGGHQIRIHDSRDCQLHIDTPGTSIIERCSNLVFNGYPPELVSHDPSSMGPVPLNQLGFIQDFDFPFATSSNPTQFRRLTRITPLTARGRLETRARLAEQQARTYVERTRDWKVRLDARIEIEEEMTKAWREEPWHPYSVIAPVHFGTVVRQDRVRKIGKGTKPDQDQASTRLYSTKTEARKTSLRSQFSPSTEIDLVRIMQDLRQLELLELIKGVSPKSAVGFKDAHRALYPLYHRLDQRQVEAVTFGDLDAALPEFFSSAWTTIEQRLVNKKVLKLELLSKHDKAMLNLVAFYSIGPKRAEAFVEYGCKTADDLIAADQKGAIKLSKAQKIGLLHKDDIDRLIPRQEMEKLKEALEDSLKRLDPEFECEILGSYRRGVGFSSDIDLAVRHKTFIDKDQTSVSKPMMDSIVKQLEAEGLITKENELMLGPKKYAGLIKLPQHQHFRRIDIRLAPYPSYPYMLLGTTGDALLMKLLRHTAKKKGWCLNEFGLGEKYAAEDENPNGFRPGTLKIVKNEREIFELLGFPYLEPEQRDCSVWIEIFRKAGVPGLDRLHRL